MCVCVCVCVCVCSYVYLLYACVCVMISSLSTSLWIVFSLGLLSDRPVDKQGTPFDSLATHLLHTLAYGQFSLHLFCMFSVSFL